MSGPVRTYAGWRTFYDREGPVPQSDVVTRKFFDLGTGKMSRSVVWRLRRQRVRKWLCRPWVRVWIVPFPRYGRRLAVAEQKIARLESQIDALVTARLQSR